MIQDQIVEEIHKTRRENALKFDFNLDAIYQHLRQLEQQSRLKMVSLPSKRIHRKVS